MRQFLAWKSIEDERETLNLDTFQSKQAETKRAQADETVDAAHRRDLPVGAGARQPRPDAAVEWEETRVQGADAAGRARRQEAAATRRR